jgi:hypothetical protein
MSSVLAQYAQRPPRDTTVVPVVPGNGGELVIDPRHSSLFTVDLSTLESDTNVTIQLPNTNRHTTGTGMPATGQSVYYVHITTDSTIAVAYPGLEYTVYFTLPTWTVNAVVSVYYDNESCDILSPLDGFYNYKKQSITLKSDGKTFSVVSSGPQAWSYGTYDC